MLEFSQYFYSLEGEAIDQFHADCAAVSSGQTFETLEELWRELPSKCDNFEWVYYVMIGAGVSVKESYEVVWDADGRIQGFTTPEKAANEANSRLCCSISDPDENGMVTVKEYDGDKVLSETIIRQKTTEESQKEFAEWAIDFYTKKRDAEVMHQTNYPDIKSIWQERSK